MRYDWNWAVIWQYREAIASGIFWTLIVSAVSIFIGTVLGVLAGLTVTSRSIPSIMRVAILAITDGIRALPLLILILLVDYFLPPFLHINSIFWLSVIALSVNLAAFVSDVMRGAIHGVPRPLIDAGLAVGMTEAQVSRRIVLPEAVRMVIPTFSLLYIDILKMSSLTSVIGFRELTHVGGDINSITFHPLEVMVTVAIIYLVLIIPIAHFQRWLERSALFVRRS